MTPSAEELFKAGLDLPPALRKEVALRLLESVEVVDESIDEAWAEEIASRVDDIVSGKVATIPHEDVLAMRAAGRAERQASRDNGGPERSDVDSQS